MNFSEAMFDENYMTLDFHTNTVVSRRILLLVKMASKTMLRPIVSCCPVKVKERKQRSGTLDNSDPK